MTTLPNALYLKPGLGLLIIDALGEAREFKLYQGDALQHGGPEQLWLLDEGGHYLRKLPTNGHRPGPALFENALELLDCLEQKRFYFEEECSLSE